MKQITEEDIREVYYKLVPESLRLLVKPLLGKLWPPLKQNSTRLLDEVLYRRAQARNKHVCFMSPRLQKLRGKYDNQRCFIMGNGPSLNKMNLDLLKDDHVWGTNKCYLLFDRICWRPSFYTAVDTRVVPDIADNINRLSSNLDETTFFFPVRYGTYGIIDSRKNIYWYREVPLDENNIPHGMFSLDASKTVASVRTVTIAAMQLAVYLGFNPIYLIGCDTNYSVPKTVNVDANDSDKLISTRDDDLNHFDPRYFGKDSKWHEPHVDRMIRHYEYTKAICDAIDVKVYNATVGGKLEVFPRVQYKELFQLSS